MEGYNYVCDDPVLHIISRKQAKELGMKWYFTGKPCVNGHLSIKAVANHHCNKCAIERRVLNKNEDSEYQKMRYKNNKEIYSKKDRERYLSNPEVVKERVREWKENNKERVREYYREYCKNRMKNDPDFYTTKYMRIMLRRCLNQTGKVKTERTSKLLNYSSSELKEHLERLFLSEMSWEDTSSFHIDHIYPVSRYVSEGVTDPAVINALSNLAPMYPEDNLSKGARTLEEWLDEKGEHSREWKLYSRLLKK